MSAQGLKFEGPYLPEFLPVDNSKGIKSILKVLENSKIFEKKAFGGICTHTAHPKSASTKKAEKQQKSRIFDQNFKSAIWVFLPFPNIFRTFFLKNQWPKRFLERKNFHQIHQN